MENAEEFNNYMHYILNFHWTIYVSRLTWQFIHYPYVNLCLANVDVAGLKTEKKLTIALFKIFKQTNYSDSFTFARRYCQQQDVVICINALISLDKDHNRKQGKGFRYIY